MHYFIVALLLGPPLKPVLTQSYLTRTTCLWVSSPQHSITRIHQSHPAHTSPFTLQIATLATHYQAHIYASSTLCKRGGYISSPCHTLCVCETHTVTADGQMRAAPQQSPVSTTKA